MSRISPRDKWILCRSWYSRLPSGVFFVRSVHSAPNWRLLWIFYAFLLPNDWTPSLELLHWSKRTWITIFSFYTSFIRIQFSSIFLVLLQTNLIFIILECFFFFFPDTNQWNSVQTSYVKRFPGFPQIRNFSNEKQHLIICAKINKYSMQKWQESFGHGHNHDGGWKLNKPALKALVGAVSMISRNAEFVIVKPFSTVPFSRFSKLRNSSIDQFSFPIPHNASLFLLFSNP